MFINKKNREIDKEIMSNLSSQPESENFIINIKTEHQNQILSTFNYDNKDTLNSEFSDYLWKNAKMMPPNKDLQINIYSKENINEQEVIKATKSHYAREYAETKLSLSRTNFVVSVIGSVGLQVLFMEVPSLSVLLELSPVPYGTLFILLAISLVMFVIGEIYKIFVRKQAKKNLVKI